MDAAAPDAQTAPSADNPVPTPPSPTQPAEVPGLRVAAGEDPVRAWGRLPAGTQVAFVRFPRGGDLPLAVVQRLARRGSVIVDAGPRDPGDVLDLAVAGAAVVVAWLAEAGDVEGMADAVGDGFLLGCTAKDAARAAQLAREHGYPLLVDRAEPPEGTHGYRTDLAATLLMLHRYGEWPELDAGPGPEELDADGGDADGLVDGDDADDVDGDVLDEGGVRS